MPDIARNNHYVPQFYLNAWAVNRKIWEYRLLVSSEKVPLWSVQSMEHVASGQNMYVRIISGEEYDDFETDFNKRFETPASEPIRKLRAYEKLTATDWHNITRLIACQYVRTPAFYQSIKPTMDKLHESFADEMPMLIERYLKGERKTSQATNIDRSLFPMAFQLTGKHIDDSHQEAYFSLVSGKSTWLFSIRHSLTDGSSTLSIFENRKWSVVRFNNNLPTTDNPVSFVDAIEGMQIDDIGTKMSKGGRLIVFPVSPDVAIISKTAGSRLPPVFNASASFAKYIKKAIVRNAFMYVYAKETDDDIAIYRKRVVNLEQFKRINEAFDGWYSQYQATEAPLLTHSGWRLTLPEGASETNTLTSP